MVQTQPYLQTKKPLKTTKIFGKSRDKTNSRWPFDALVSFHAYAPFNDATDGMWSVTTDADNVKTKIKYTAKSGETEILSARYYCSYQCRITQRIIR